MGATALLELFSTCPRLESVELPSESISSTSFVSVLRERVAAARSGGCSLVRKLSLEGISLGPLAQLGSAFPELEELTVGCVKSSGDQALRGWAPLPRLRAVRFKSLGSNGWGCGPPPATLPFALSMQTAGDAARSSSRTVLLQLFARTLPQLPPQLSTLCPSCPPHCPSCP